MTKQIPVSILVNPVENGTHEILRHGAFCCGDWYFVDGEGLSRINESALAAAGASLAAAKPVFTPSGVVKGVLAFKNRLLIGVAPTQRGDCQLYTAEPDGLWQPSLDVKGRLNNWCRDSHGRYCFAVVDPIDKLRVEPRQILVSEDGKSWRVFEELSVEEADHIHNICVVGDRLIILVGDTHFRHMSIRALGDEGELIQDAARRIRVPLELSHRSLFRVLPRCDGTLLYALDGATEIYDQVGDFWRSDYAKDSGCQIAAHACFPWAEKTLFLGTWRHSEAHPYPCLYIVGHEGMGKYVELSQPFSEEYAWCGFQDMESTLIYPGSEAMHGRFWPCAGGVSLFLLPLTEIQAEEKKRTGLPVVRSDQLSGSNLISLPPPPFILDVGKLA
nr:hypothetical protein [uncultured Pseudodesulfovibrio sp.]